MPRRRQLSIASADRAREIVELRTQRWTFEQIGDRFGIAPSRVHKIFWDAVGAIPAAAVEQLRAEQNALTDFAVRELVEIAAAERTSTRSKIEALSAMARWARHYSLLNGLDVDRRISDEDRGNALPSDWSTQVAERVRQLQEERTA